MVDGVKSPVPNQVPVTGLKDDVDGSPDVEEVSSEFEGSVVRSGNGQTASIVQGFVDPSSESSDDEEFFDCEDDPVLFGDQSGKLGTVSGEPRVLDGEDEGQGDILPMKVRSSDPELGDVVDHVPGKVAEEDVRKQDQGTLQKLWSWGGTGLWGVGVAGRYTGKVVGTAGVVVGYVANKTGEALTSVAHKASYAAPVVKGVGLALQGAGMLTEALGSGVNGVADFLPDVGTSTKPKEPSRYEKNIARFNELSTAIDKRMRELDSALRQVGIDTLARDPEPLTVEDEQEMSFWSQAEVWRARLSGHFSAATTTAGWLAVSAGLPTVTSMVSSWIPGLGALTGIGLNLTALTAGAYMGLSALRAYPELAGNEAALSLISKAMNDVKPQLIELATLMNEEQLRSRAMQRSVMVSAERQQRLDVIVANLKEVDRAFNIAENLEKSKPLELSGALKHEVAIGDGKKRNAMLEGVASVKNAFSSFFAKTSRAASSFANFFATMPDRIDAMFARRKARKVEQDYLNNEGKGAFRALGQKSDSSEVAFQSVVLSAERRKISGTEEIHKLEKQCFIGENLARRLQSQDESGLGVVVYPEEGSDKKYVVASSLTTTKALASYFDMQASDKADANGVRRESNGDLVIPDPGGKLFGYLKLAPTAYTVGMVSDKGVLAQDAGQGPTGKLMIDDHGTGFPGGARRMEFYADLDEAGNHVLRLHFSAEQSRPVFRPLENEFALLKDLRVAMHSSNQTVREVQDFKGWSLEQLNSYRDALYQEFDKQNKLFLHEADELKQMDDRRIPPYVQAIGSRV